MSNSKPLVSIGMPVYNGERFIREALDSLLAQDYENFELIISDNASTDRTQDICEEYAKSDPRIRYYRNKENIGSWDNFKKVAELALGKYFMWAAHDDVWHPTYIRELSALLEQYNSAVLAVCQATKIDLDGSRVWVRPLVQSSLGMRRIDRLTHFLENVYGALIYGMFKRCAVINALELMDQRSDPMGADLLMVLKCIDKGDVIALERPLYFQRRYGLSSNSNFYQGVHQVASSHLNYSLLLFRCFDWPSLSLSEKASLFKACSLHIARRVVGKYYRNVIAEQVKRALQKAIS